MGYILGSLIMLAGLLAFMLAFVMTLPIISHLFGLGLAYELVFWPHVALASALWLLGAALHWLGRTLERRSAVR